MEDNKTRGLADLNQKLFDRIEALENEDLTDEQLEREIKKTESVTKVAEVILENANLALKAQKQFDEYGTGRSVDIPLLGISNAGLAQENRMLRQRLAKLEDEDF
jgi:hypothetical protein